MKSLLECGLGVLAVLASAAVCAAFFRDPPKPGVGSGGIVFMCEHGNVKSLIASEWFNHLAAERGLTVRAVSRGLSPEVVVPARIAEHLRGDGFDVRSFRPRALARVDLVGAARLVVIGSQPPSWVSAEPVAVERWDGIPPASESYDASRAALRDRIVVLLESLGPRSVP